MPDLQPFPQILVDVKNVEDIVVLEKYFVFSFETKIENNQFKKRLWISPAFLNFNHKALDS